MDFADFGAAVGPAATPPPLRTTPGGLRQTPVAAQPPAGQSPLGESDFLAIRQATAARKAVKSAARVALTSSVVTLCIGVSAVPFVIFWPSWLGVAMAVGLCTIGVVEYCGHRRMLKAEPSAARILGLNQLAFVGLICFYCVVQMLTFSTEEMKSAALSPEVRSQLTAMPSMEDGIDNQIDKLGPVIVYGFYGLVIVLSVFSQGGLAIYYFTRRKRLEYFQSQTPEWIRRLFIETL